MTGLHKFSSKSICFIFVTVVFCICIMPETEAHYSYSPQFYLKKTADTITIRKKDTLSSLAKRDTSGKDSSVMVQKIDTFSLKVSKDTLDGPVNYEAADSAVLMIKDQKFYLYGKTKTTYKDVVLTSPKVQFNQQTNIMTAFNGKDSLGNVVQRAEFQQGQQSFQSDTIEFNFKNQKGLTKNTYTKQDQMFVQAELLKKINPTTTFAKRV